MTAAVIPFPGANVVPLPTVREIADDVIAYIACVDLGGSKLTPCGLSTVLAARGWSTADLAAYLHVARDIAERETGVRIR